MPTPAGNEISVRVRIDGSLATQDAERVKKDVAGKFTKGFASLSAAALGFFYGGIANRAKSSLAGFGDLIGRGTDLGRNASEFYGKLGAKKTAAEQTVEAFGLAGKSASREQILSVYNMYKGLEELKAAGRANIEGAVGEKELDATWKAVASDFKVAVNNFGEVIKELGRQFRLH